MSLKTCFVPKCLNTSKNSNKLFISIPTNEETRKKWFSVVKIPVLGRKDLFCCEDHFDMEHDAKNWMHYKLMGSRLFMREDVFPHKHLVEPKPPSESSQLSLSERKRKTDILDGRIGKSKKSTVSCTSIQYEIQKKHLPVEVLPQSKEIVSSRDSIIVPLNDEIKLLQSSKSSYVPVTKENKEVQVNIKPLMRNMSTNTNEVFTRTVSPEHPRRINDRNI